MPTKKLTPAQKRANAKKKAKAKAEADAKKAEETKETPEPTKTPEPAEANKPAEAKKVVEPDPDNEKPDEKLGVEKDFVWYMTHDSKGFAKLKKATQDKLRESYIKDKEYRHLNPKK